MVNVLHVIWGLNIGGAETFLFNVLSKLDSNTYHVDFVIQDHDIKNKKLLMLCECNNWNIYKVPQFNKNLIKYVESMNKIIGKPYKVVHIHMNALINIIPIFIAANKNKKIIIHSHNSSNNLGGNIGRILHLINRRILNKIKTINVACSELAGKWMFGNKDYLLLENGIDVESFKFNEEYRKIVRDKYHIGDNVVIGHVGRFVKAKNHEFVLHVFKQYLNEDKNALLMLVGDGPLKTDMMKMAKELNINDNVIFVGEVDSTIKYYSAFDSFFFPSLFEGLPFVLIEAQSSGLPIVASNKITSEVNVSGNIVFLNLEDNLNYWINFMKRKNKSEDRIKISKKMLNSKYNIENTIHVIEKLYSD